MGLFKRKADPISDRAKALAAQIAALEAQIKKLDGKLQQGEVAAPKASPNGASSAAVKGGVHPVFLREPVFEPVERVSFDPSGEPEQSPDHYNDLGVRKYDLAGAWRRLRGQFRGPPAGNPKLVTYLAAGSIKGLRPLRYEKRIARNRFIVLFVVLVCLLWGIIAVFVRSH